MLAETVMTRDYRRGSPRTKSGTKSTPKRHQNCSCIGWLLLGALLGASATALYLNQPEQTAASAPDGDAARAQRPLPEPPSFQFPQLLRDTEVDINTGDLPSPPPAPRPPPPKPPESAPAAESSSPPAPAEPVRAETRAEPGFVVQAGAFRHSGDAERLRAQLGMLGLTSHIQPVTLPSGETYHRVRVGPYSSKQDADRVRARIQQSGQDAMTLPLR